jgi:hypothetical protein
MQATVYLFDDLAWRKRARWSRPADPRDLDQFVCQLEALLKRLGDLHLRISLARLPVGELGAEATRLGQAIVDNLQDPCALVGLMPDSSVVAAFLGPRASDSTVADEEMTARISLRFERALRLAKTDRGGLLAGLTVAHCWSDEIFDVPSLVLELASVHGTVTDIASIDRSSGRRPA